MSTDDDLLAAFAAARNPTVDSVARARERLRVGTDEEAALALLRALPRPSDTALARLRARLLRSIQQAALPRLVPVRWGRISAVGAVAAVLAIASVVVPAVLVPPPARPIAAKLESTEPTVSEPAPGVVVTAMGWGFVSGSEKEPSIQWGAGSLRVEVAPGAGIDLSVETPSGSVRVLGTVFTVDVTDLGTYVTVQRGRVEVACVLSTPEIVTAGGEATCVRASAANLLNLAIASRSGGSADGRVLGLTDRGLALQEDEGPVQDELRLLRLSSLLALGRPQEARSAADDYLAAPAPGRRTDVLRTAAKLAISEGGCALGAPYLRDLRVAPAARADDLLPLARCLLVEDPATARTVLDEAGRLTPTGDVAAHLAALRAQLGP